MKADKNSKQQILILGILVILFVGFVSFQIMGSNKGQSTAKSGAKTPAATTATETAKTDTLKDTMASSIVVSSIEFPNIKQAVPRRDPFKAVYIEMGETAPISNNNEITKISKANKIPMPNFNNMKLPPLNMNSAGSLQPVNPFNQGSNSGVTIAKTIEKDEQFTLTGVIKGSQSIAILRSGEGSRIIAREGDMISGKLKLLNISQDNVILSSGNHIIRIPLGGDNNAG